MGRLHVLGTGFILGVVLFAFFSKHVLGIGDFSTPPVWSIPLCVLLFACAVFYDLATTSRKGR